MFNTVVTTEGPLAMKAMMHAHILTTARRLTAPALVLAAAAALPGAGRASAIAPDFNLTPAEARRPILLDADGRVIRTFKGLRGPSSTHPAGASPSYVAFRLGDPKELPAGYPTIQVQTGRTPGQGPAQGPLRLDSLAKSALDAELAQTGAVAVRLPRQTFVVESAATALGAAGKGKIWIAPTRPVDRPGHEVHSEHIEQHGNAGRYERHDLKTGSTVGGTVKGWANSGVDAIQNLNKSITDSIKKQLRLDSPKPAVPPPSKHPKTAAEMLVPPTQAADADAAQPAPVPEPAGFVVFAVAAAAAAIRTRRRRS